MPEVIEDFFVAAAPETGLQPKAIDGKRAATSTASARCRAICCRSATGRKHRFGRLGREYGKIVFDKALLQDRPHAGMGHARPSAVRGGAHRRA